MRPTITTYKFTVHEMAELKEKTGLTNGEKALERWARHQYPIGKGTFVIGDINLDENGGEIEVIER